MKCENKKKRKSVRSTRNRQTDRDRTPFFLFLRNASFSCLRFVHKQDLPNAKTPQHIAELWNIGYNSKYSQLVLSLWQRKFDVFIPPPIIEIISQFRGGGRKEGWLEIKYDKLRETGKKNEQMHKYKMFKTSVIPKDGMEMWQGLGWMFDELKAQKRFVKKSREGCIIM